MIDHDMKTDVLVFNGGKFLRIQVKTVDTNDEGRLVENKWEILMSTSLSIFLGLVTGVISLSLSNDIVGG